jgi:hypothetical protein
MPAFPVDHVFFHKDRPWKIYQGEPQSERSNGVGDQENADKGGKKLAGKGSYGKTFFVSFQNFPVNSVSFHSY